MKNLIIIIILIVPINLWAFDIQSDYPLDKNEKKLLGAQIVLHSIDWLQTLKIARNPDKYYEKLNFILREHPSENEVNLYMGVYLLSTVIMEYYAPDILETFGFNRKQARMGRKIFQGIFIMSSGYCVWNNFSIGLGFGIDF